MENIILYFLAFLPIFYKYNFWFFLVQLKEYRIDRFCEYIKTPQGKKAIFNFLFFLEIFTFFLVLFSFFFLKQTKFIFYFFSSFLILENIFIFIKIFKKQFFLPKITGRFCFTFTIFLCLEIGLLFIFKNPYFFIFSNLFLFLPIIFLAIFISLPIVLFLKNKKIKKAKNISKNLKEVIKIGITGSYGKTSQKEFLNQILGENFRVLASPKNINTEIGISDLIISKLSNNYDYFIAEMGAYKVGEIKTLGKIVNHKYGFLTAIGTQHLALFGGIEKTIKAKMEIADKIIENNGILYVNGDDKNIKNIKFSKKLKVIKYGIQNGNDAKSEVLEIKNGFTKFEFKYKGLNEKFKTNILGNHNIINLTGILAFCFDIGLEKDDFKEIFKNLKTPENTLKLIEIEENKILNDTYNLSEGGLFAGLETMNSFEKTKEKILIIDDILELGEKSEEIHFKIAKKIAKNSLATKVFYVGVNYKKEFVNGLIKGGMKLSSIINNLENIGKNNILLFEGRKSLQELNKFLGKKQ